MSDVLVVRTDDAKAAMIVTHRKWKSPFHRPMFRELLRILPRNVSGWHVELIDARKNDLHGAAFRAHDEIDAARVAMHALLELTRCEHEQHDGRDPERKQKHV